jgi:NitT/TauT family transport system permease protein
MTARTLDRLLPPILGFGTLILCVLIIELLIRFNVVNRFIVPMPSQIAGAFERVILEEDIPHRFLVTMRESLWATALLALFGIGIGVLLYRVRLLRDATETWVGADRADVSAVPGDFRPQREDHHHDGVRGGPSGRDPEDH